MLNAQTNCIMLLRIRSLKGNGGSDVAVQVEITLVSQEPNKVKTKVCALLSPKFLNCQASIRQRCASWLPQSLTQTPAPPATSAHFSKWQ